MFDKYSNILTMILIFFVVAICGIIGYFAYDLFNSNNINSNAQSAIDELDKAIQCAKDTKGLPTAIILDTIKGKGAKFVEDAKTGNHSMAVSKQDVENFLKEVGE